MQPSFLAVDHEKAVQSAFISKVYGWMSTALLITGVTAYWAFSTPAVTDMIFKNKLVFFGLIIAQLGLVVYLSARIERMSSETATLVFFLYALLTGLTFSSIFLVYTEASISSTFLVTGVTFGTMSAYGYFTKKDLTSIGNLAFMALLGLIIASIVNIFMKSEMLYWLVSYAGILIFVGLTAYDTQKIKQMALQVEGDEMVKKASIRGALSLYLDFINLFLMLLRVMGDRR